MERGVEMLAMMKKILKVLLGVKQSKMGIQTKHMLDIPVLMDRRENTFLILPL